MLFFPCALPQKPIAPVTEKKAIATWLSRCFFCSFGFDFSKPSPKEYEPYTLGNPWEPLGTLGTTWVVETTRAPTDSWIHVTGTSAPSWTSARRGPGWYTSPGSRKAMPRGWLVERGSGFLVSQGGRTYPLASMVSNPLYKGYISLVPLFLRESNVTSD